MWKKEISRSAKDCSGHPAVELQAATSPHNSGRPESLWSIGPRPSQLHWDVSRHLADLGEAIEAFGLRVKMTGLFGYSGRY